MKALTRTALLLPLLMLVLLMQPGFASATDIVRKVLQKADLTGKPDTQVIVTHVDLMPGSSVPLHTHPGDEFLYILKGGTVAAPGKPPIRFKAGQTVHFPRGKVHGGFTVEGTEPLSVVTIHIVDKGVPVMVPVKK
jgi:quercetin dioxygenase-like cupin family protein